MKSTVALIVALLAIIAVAFTVTAGDTESSESKEKSDCPVMGGKVNKEIYEEYNGERIYFCCESCREKFKEDPEKYLEMKEAGELSCDYAHKANTKCPTCGMDVNKEISGTYHGCAVYFCAEGCKEKFEKDPHTYMKKMGCTHDETATKSGCGSHEKKSGCATKKPCSMECMSKGKKG